MTLTAGVAVNAAAPVTVNGLTVVLGVIAPKLNSRTPAALTVRAAFVHALALSVMETLLVAVVAFRITVEFAQLPPTTPCSLPPLMVVLPL